MDVPDNLPWYRNPELTHPFALAQRIACNHPDAAPFYSVATFPWAVDSLNSLWDGALIENSSELQSDWTQMVREWHGALVVGGRGKLYLVPGQGSKLEHFKPLCIRLPQNDATGHADVRCIAWALTQESPLDPLILFAASGLLYVVDAKKRKIISYLRGHGGAITSIVVHPTHPYLFCTTSRDHTTRIYDLTLTPCQKPNNPHWPPAAEPSRAGAAYGLHMTEPEGVGIGRCVAILCGGRSGGHQAAVLSACFHPTLPLIATCGMDRVAKIWNLPSLEGRSMSREDKPLFSTSLLHKARILSITWLSQDTLLTHSAPALMRRAGPADLYEQEGTIVVWRWLGVDRFFPPGKEYQKVLRGCASDYQESSSFKIISAVSLPMTARHLHVYQSAAHDPLVLCPLSNAIRTLNVIHMKPRTPPPFPYGDKITEMTGRMRLTDPQDDDEPSEGGSASDSQRPRASVEVKFGPESWEIKTVVGEGDGPAPIELEACEMSQGGKVITGVGSKGSIWIWRMND